jgi:hypothetical protein
MAKIFAVTRELVVQRGRLDLIRCAVGFEPVCANMGFFDTLAEHFRAGLVLGK